MKKDCIENECGAQCARPDWQLRLLDERNELLKKTLKLKKFINDDENKLSNQEWNLLHRQFGAMRDYLEALTHRCRFYGLIEAENLDLY